MAKNLMVNKFCVRFNGVRYGKGDIIRNVPDDIAAGLIIESRGGIVEIESIENKIVETEIAVPNSIETGENTEPDSDVELVKDEELNQTTDFPVLPEVNPEATVAAAAPGKKKQS